MVYEYAVWFSNVLDHNQFVSKELIHAKFVYI